MTTKLKLIILLLLTTSGAWACNHSLTISNSKSILHHVILTKFREDAKKEDINELKRTFNELQTQVEELEKVYFIPVTSDNFNLKIVLEFTSLDGYCQYSNHRLHQRIIELAQVTVASFIDYDLIDRRASKTETGKFYVTYLTSLALNNQDDLENYRQKFNEIFSEFALSNTIQLIIAKEYKIQVLVIFESEKKYKQMLQEGVIVSRLNELLDNNGNAIKFFH